MFSDTLSLDIDGTVRDMVRINQDKYSSEYYLREDDHDRRLLIRHTSFTAPYDKAVTIDRHNVELSVVYFPDATFATPRKSKMYFVLELERRALPFQGSAFAQSLLTAFSSVSIDPSTDSFEEGAALNKLVGLES
jgi:hypothetical protein